MLYEEARVYLDHVSKYGSVLGLESIKSLLDEVGNPQEDLTFIQIAGTNGKGSILCYLSNILKESGYKTGCYSSPAVMEELETIKVNDESITKEEMGNITGEVKAAAERLQEKGRSSPTVFEIETAIAFLYFKKCKCDYVVLEAGLGGLLDATNIVENTVLSVFATISMDHVGVLGNNLTEIACNKAGIIKPGAIVVTAPQKEEVLKVLHSKADEKGCKIRCVEKKNLKMLDRNPECQKFSYKGIQNIEIGMAGDHQLENAATAIEAIMALNESKEVVSEEAMRRGLKNARWHGRFEILQTEPTIVLDGAHNEDAALRLAQSVESYFPKKKITAVMGVFKDKDYEKIVKIMSKYLTKVYTVDLPNSERSLDKKILSGVIREQGVEAKEAEDMKEALELAKKDSKKEDVILVFGSLSYLGEANRLLKGQVE